MNTLIVCNKEYARSFRKALTERDFENVWETILHYGKQFYYEKYKPHITSILQQIITYTGLEWKLFAPAEVPIYIVDMDGPSFSDPLTLKVRPNIEYMLTVLIHELIHVNFPSHLIKRDFLYEEIINQVTLKICGNLNIYSGTETIHHYRKIKQQEGYIYDDLPLEQCTVSTLFNLKIH